MIAALTIPVRFCNQDAVLTVDVAGRVLLSINSNLYTAAEAMEAYSLREPQYVAGNLVERDEDTTGLTMIDLLPDLLNGPSKDQLAREASRNQTLATVALARTAWLVQSGMPSRYAVATADTIDAI